jgi:hypothetical protein
VVIEYLPSPPEEQPTLGPIIQELPIETGPTLYELPPEKPGPLVPELPELIEKFQEEEAQREQVMPMRFQPTEEKSPLVVKIPPPVAPKPKPHVQTPPAQPMERRLPVVKPMRPLTEVESPAVQVPDFKMKFVAPHIQKFVAPPILEMKPEPDVPLPLAPPSKPLAFQHVAPIEKPTIFKFKEPEEVLRSLSSHPE